jgi:uncharacterized membrane protein
VPKEFINPNLHVILIHYPLGLLVVGTLIELFSFLGWRKSTFRAAGRWMLLIGILSLTPTLFSGLYALADVNRVPTTELSEGTPDDATWFETRQMSPIKGEAWEFMTRHAWSNAIGSVVLLVTLVLWMGSSDSWRRKLHLVWLLLLLGGLGTLVFGAWFGGEMVYRFGVGVEIVRESTSTAPPANGSGTGSPAIIEQTDFKQRLAYYAPPLQVHTILAGAAVSLALAALGVSLRAGARGDEASQNYSIEVAPVQTGIASALNPSFARARDPNDYEPDLDGPPIAPIPPRPRPAGARFWLIAALLAIATSLTGFWALAHFSDIWAPRELWERIADRETAGGIRRLAHTITGGGIIALLLLLSLVARVTAGRRFVVLLFTMLLIVTLTAQVWFGSLLMFDTPSGTLGSFNVPAGTSSGGAGETPTTAPSSSTTSPSPAVPPPTPAPGATTTTAPAPAK